jgi:hypothetical protein
MLLILAAAVPASAQTAADRPVRRIEVFGGAGLLGGAGLGSANANLRANETGRQPYRVFATDSRFHRVVTLHGGAAYALSRRFAIEGQLTFSRPELSTSVTADVEGARPIAIAERVDQYFIDGNVVFMIDELSPTARIVPFAEAGAGYLRQLHEGLTFTEEGEVYHVGGGLKYWFVPVRQGVVRAVGLRTDARAYLLARGISLGSRPRPHVAISGSVFFTF